MPDISMCQNEGCPLRDTCWRFLAPPNGERQTYGGFAPEIADDGSASCEYHWPVDSKTETK